MVEDKSIVRVLLNPNVKLDELALEDLEEGTSQQSGNRPIKLQKQLGDRWPFIKINSYRFSNDEIENVTIDCTDFLPIINIRLSLSKSIFISKDFPKDGDMINIFIRSRNDILKPIRNDYLITNVSTNMSYNNQGEGMKINVSGVLFIPGLLDETTFSKDGTSFEILNEIAQTLGLGFATNESSTDDRQVWICARDTSANFIQEVTGSSWKNTNSFFNSFIDIYYNLNFINVNNQLGESGEIYEALVDNLMAHDLTKEETPLPIDTMPKVLSNMRELKDTNMYIQRYKLVNNSSEISNMYGYKMHAEFFEQNSLQHWDIFSEPIISEGAEKNKILLKGRVGENYYKNTIKKRWLGVQYSLDEHNTHDKYLFSNVHNLINLKELDKLELYIDIPRTNFNIYKGERIPCAIFSIGDPQKSEILKENVEDPVIVGKPIVDKFFSGFFYVKGMIFKYESYNALENSTLSFTETLILSRREWPTP